MSKKARLTGNELDALIEAEIACRVGTANTVAGGKAEIILAKYNELINREYQSKARPISKSTVEHKLAEWRRDGKIPPAAASLPTEDRPSGSDVSFPLDQPWSVGCLAEYEIPPEALPIVMWIYEKRLREEGQHFSIREALWIARLYKLIDDPIILERFAYAYALREQIDWILGKPTYTRDIDITAIQYSFHKDMRAKFYQFPFKVRQLPTWGNEEEEELRRRLTNKGYILESNWEKDGGKQ